MRTRIRLVAAALHVALVATAGGAQLPAASDSLAGVPAVEREFRGVWVASVDNIDWPSRRGLSTCDQQAELIALLDRAVALHLNAIILQVRPAADALYASRLEPWSEYLTGVQGRAPSPWYDPLAFAVQEAHARGLELHAWFNPYRARQSRAKSPPSASHVARTMPSLVKSYGPYLWMDPGEPAIRRRTLAVVLDVVRRYDIDGVHIDDYFYPYQEYDRRGRVIDFPDTRSWKRYRKGGGRLARADWRRHNVDELVKQLYTGVHAVKPWVKFGISPFGIWRPGNPPSITGYDAYERLYGDSRKWLRSGWVDYYTPQLYWPIAQIPQSYPTLLGWWVEQNEKGRHMWPGNYTNKVGPGRDQGWAADEVLEQIRITRAQPGDGQRALQHDRIPRGERLARHSPRDRALRRAGARSRDAVARRRDACHSGPAPAPAVALRSAAAARHPDALRRRHGRERDRASRRAPRAGQKIRARALDGAGARCRRALDHDGPPRKRTRGHTPGRHE